MCIQSVYSVFYKIRWWIGIFVTKFVKIFKNYNTVPHPSLLEWEIGTVTPGTNALRIENKIEVQICLGCLKNNEDDAPVWRFGGVIDR